MKNDQELSARQQLRDNTAERNRRRVSILHLRRRSSVYSAVAGFLPLAAALLLLSGCASTATKPQVGVIAITNANGVAQPSITSMTVGTGTYMDAAVTNDNELLGVNWTVSCGSELPVGTPLPAGETVDTSCGYFTPAHTASAPVPTYAATGSGVVTFYTAPAAPPKGGTVTLYAAAASDPSRFSTLTLNVAGLPIAIAIVASTPPPFSLPVNGTIALTGVLSNDYTVGGGSVNWTVTCSSSACGSFSATKTLTGIATTYTAPASVPTGSTGSAVIVTATSVTDSSKSTTAQIQIH